MISIEAICTPDIYDPLINRNVKAVSTNYNHLKNLKLADSSNTDTKSINILIGLDYYYLLVTGDIIRAWGTQRANNCFKFNFRMDFEWSFYRNHSS